MICATSWASSERPPFRTAPASRIPSRRAWLTLRQFVFLAIFTCIAGWGQAAQAVPISWTLNNVTFDDGGTASGSFLFDADSSTFSSINISTSAGTAMTAGTYSDLHPFYVGSSLPALILSDSVPVTVRLLQLPFLDALTNAGGTVSLGGLGNFGEGACGGAPCQNVDGNLPLRFISGGEVVAQSAPAPATTALLGLALLGAGCARRRLAH